MKIHALTLNYNAEDKLKKLRCGLLKNFAYISMRGGKPIISEHNYPVWHVRDNGSTDSSVAYLENCEKSDFQTIIHKITHNAHSFSQGMNYLFEQANPKDDDLILLLNNDVQFNDSKSLSKMIELQKKTKADVVGCRLLYTDTNNLQHAGVIFSNKYGTMPYHFRHNDQSDANAEKNRYFQAVTAACCLVKAGAFRQVGGFDNGYRWAFEDVDLILKIGQLKPNNVIYCGETNIYHDESATLNKNKLNKLFLSSNVKHFKNTWAGKYEIDHDKYLNDPSYNEA